MKSPPSADVSRLLSLEQLQEMWLNLADRYFDSRLPAIRIEWSSRLTASTGMFVSRVGPRDRYTSPGFRHGEGRVIRLSARLLHDQGEDEVVRTLAHEMIHQWQFDIRHCRPSHGRHFYTMMDRINQDGLGISVHHGLQDPVESLNRYAWRCVGCGYAYHRQRRTILATRHRCGRCGGRLIETDLKKSFESLSDREGIPSHPEGSRPLNPGCQLSFDF